MLKNWKRIITDKLKYLWNNRKSNRIKSVSLNNFIQKSLVDISDGIENSEKELESKKLNSVINAKWCKNSFGDSRDSKGPRGLVRDGEQGIKFKVLVEVSTDIKTHGQINVVTGVLNFNSDGKTIKGMKQTSEIEFLVPMVLSFSDRSSNYYPKK
jgi:hypothetical protein